MMVVPEGGSLYHHNMNMIVDGHTGIEHSVPGRTALRRCLAVLAENEGRLHADNRCRIRWNLGENYWYQHTNVWENERLLRYVPKRVVDPRSRSREMAPEDEFNHIDIARGAKQLLDRGVKVNLGAHGQMQGLAPHWEIVDVCPGRDDTL